MKTTVYFTGGRVSCVIPAVPKPYYMHRDTIYDADYIVSDGVRYDLTNPKEVYSIPIPDYKSFRQNSFADDLGSTGYIEYILRMKAGDFYNKKMKEQWYACLAKATNMMLYSDLGWPRKEFFRIVEWLERDGYFKTAEEWKAWISDNVPTNAEYMRERMQDIIKRCIEVDTNYVYITWVGACSGVTAKYQGRVYSLSGKHSKFPILPQFILNCGCVYSDDDYSEGAVGGPFIFHGDRELDTIYYKGEDVPALTASWRKWGDDRSQEEKNNYYACQERVFREKESRENISLYNRIYHSFPEICPKSISTFYKWETSKPEKYAMIVDSARNKGLVIPRIKEFYLFERGDPMPNYHGK